MARAVAEEITVEFFEKLNKKGKGAVDLIEKINRMLKEDRAYQKSLYEGMKAILSHMEKGGATRCIEVPFNVGANEIFKDLMKKYQIPYVSAVTGNKEKEQIFYRDKDKSIVAMCRIELINLLNIMCEELSPKDFIKKYTNDEISGIKGLDKGDIEFIRREIAERNENNAEIDYTVVRDPTDEKLEMIFFPASLKNVIEKITDRVAYDFSGDEGRENKKTVLEMVKEKDRLKNIISNNVNAGKEICLVDSINPNMFCLVNEDGVYLHSLSHEKRKLNDGSIEEYIKDDVVGSSKQNSIDRFIPALYKPVIMTLKEVNLIKGLDNNGKIKTDVKTFDKDLSILKKKTLVLPGNRHFLADTVINSIRKPMEQRIRTFIGLDEKAIGDIEKLVNTNNLKETVILAGEVSCTEKDLDVIEKYIRDNVYRAFNEDEVTELTPLREYELKFLHEGRGTVNLTDRNKMKEESQYIVDACDERYLFRINGETLSAFDNREEFLKVRMDSEDFSENIIQIIENLKEPVVLSKEDILNKDRHEILEAIKEKRPDTKDYVSKEALRSNIVKRYSREFEEMNGKIPDNPTDRQKEALKKIERYKNNTVTIRYSKDTEHLFKEPNKPVTVNKKEPDLSYQ